MAYRNFSIGADPEVFVRDTNLDQFVKAGGLIHGDKEAPFCPDYHYVDDRYQVDGLAAEFNVTPVDLNIKGGRTQFIGNVGRIFKRLERDIKKRNHNAVLVAQPTAEFGQTYMDSLPDEDKELGCDPDYNGWDGNVNRRPDGAKTFRTGSGHVHVGFQDEARLKERMYDHDMNSNEFYELCMEMACELDYYLGMPSLLWDGDAQRRQLYGKAGAFRPKPYGMEYRVLSNVWVANDYLIGYVYDATNLMVKNFFDGKKFKDKYGAMAMDIINNNETDWVEKYGNILVDFGHNLPEIK